MFLILKQKIRPSILSSKARVAFMGSIKEAGGSWSAKATAEEEKFIHEHEVEVLAKLKAKQAERSENNNIKPIGKNQKSDEKTQKPAKSTKKDNIVTPEALGFATTGGRSGVFGSREGALEDKWIRDHERELSEKQK